MRTIFNLQSPYCMHFIQNTQHIHVFTYILTIAIKLQLFHTCISIQELVYVIFKKTIAKTRKEQDKEQQKRLV